MGEHSVDVRQLPMELLRAQGQTLIRLRNEGKIGDEAMHRIERDLDLEESRLEVRNGQDGTSPRLMRLRCAEGEAWNTTRLEP